MLTIYKASAGSGKTYTLAYEYVRLLLGIKAEGAESYKLNASQYLGGRTYSNRHRHILAITFTNKATEEMKTRIVKELGSLAAEHADGSEDCPYTTDLIKEFGCTREELRDTAAKALRDLLFDYHHFNVSTIDSFFQTVLRAFAREVDRQGDYGLELSDEFAVTSGIGMMLDDLNYGNPSQRERIMKWIRNYTMNLVESGKDGSMFNRSGSLLKNLSAYVKKMGSEVFKQASDQVLKYLEEPGRMAAFVKEIDNHIANLNVPLAQRASGLIAAFDSTGYDRRVLPDAAWRIITSTANGDTPAFKDFSLVGIQKILAWHTAHDGSFYTKKYCPGSAKEKILPTDSFSEALCDWMNNCYRIQIEIHALGKVREACPNLEFLGFTWHYINRFREENNLILLSDTHDLLQRIIGGSDSPFIYERIGVVLRHFLIDEFQDTSHMQWNNLKPLVADSLATGCDNLIIGDEKQAIYRFRNSDSSLLHHVVAEQDFPENHCMRGNCSAENTNYRSATDIVRFNNTLFTRIARNCGVSGYENTIQATKVELPSYIRIYDTAGAEKINDYAAEFEITAREIIRQHKAGYRWSDIAILVRKRSEAEAMVNYLLKYHTEIKVLSDEALLLRNSPAVKLVISMLKLVDESYSAMSDNKAADAKGTPVYGSAGDIRMMISRYEYFTSEGHDATQALRMALEPSSADGKHANIGDSIFDIRSSHPSGLLSLVETIIAKKVPSERRRNEYAYLAAFQDEVINYCKNYNPSVHAFLDWWADASQHLAINAGAGQDAVAVMTVHKSKGLQWSCVHVPFGDWELVRNSDSLWICPDCLSFVDQELLPPLISVELDKTCALDGSPLQAHALRNRNEQLVDNLNATYVAYTRPKRELTICFAKQKAAGAEVFAALGANQSNYEPTDLCMDLAANLKHDTGSEGMQPVFECGAPTVPETRTAENDCSAPSPSDYKVFFREDTAALTTLDDATSEIGDIMQQEDDNAENTKECKTIMASDIEEARAAAAERGTILHSIMADINSVSDLNNAVDRAGTRLNLDRDVLEELRQVINHAFDNAGELTSGWFSSEAQILKEQSIYLPEGDSTFRPDRIIIKDDGSAEVVDYKFTTESLPSHQRQVEVYVNLLRAMGYTDVTGYLWYPELNIIKQIK